MLWPALVLLLMVGTGFILGYETIVADFEYVHSIKNSLVTRSAQDGRLLSDDAQLLLKKRPLLKIAPARGDWDWARLLGANFLHGSVPHLLLNWIGVFAGARIVTTFIPFFCTLSIFLLGGSLGLWVSMMLSSEASTFIPHIGASGGIFALMGTYYVYNFKFRTQYFFWFPSRHGVVSLRTSWFFFLDVLLLELVLSTAQFLPDRVDSVDDLAHVVGFGAGVLLALTLRSFQRWPGFLQTRGEFLYWTQIPRRGDEDLLAKAFRAWMDLLTLNPYNDQVKLHLCHLLARHPHRWTPLERDAALAFVTPTFIRLHPQAAGETIGALLRESVALPKTWLAHTPYDSIILLAGTLAKAPEDQRLLIPLVTDYRRAHPEGGQMERKLELLVAKLQTLQDGQKSA